MPPYDASKHEPIEEIDIDIEPTATRLSEPRASMAGSDHSHREPLLGFSDARVLDALADGERLGERTVSERGLWLRSTFYPTLHCVSLMPVESATGGRREVDAIGAKSLATLYLA